MGEAFARRSTAHGIQRQHVRFDGVRLIQDDGPCDDIFQLANVARPMVPAHGFHCRGVEHHAGTLRFPSMPVQEKLGQGWEVIGPFAERRQSQADDV